VQRRAERTIEAVAISQNKCTGDIFKIYTKNEGKWWIEFYKYVKRRKGNRENIPAIKDDKGQLITDSTEMPNSINFYNS
jgi:hypothetical protein